MRLNITYVKTAKLGPITVAVIGFTVFKEAVTTHWK